MEEEARHFVGGSALKPEREQIHLDLTDYQAREDALALAAHGCPSEYTEVAKRHMKGQTDLSLGYMLFGSFVSRTRGLHEGIVREIVANNPHTVLPLTRAWVETITIGLYLLRRPAYAEYLLHGPGKNRPGSLAPSRSSSPQRCLAQARTASPCIACTQ